MNDLLNSFARPDWPGAPDGRTLLFMILLAFTTGMVIGFVYMWTHEALSYSRTFVGALAVMPVIVSMLMASMSGSCWSLSDCWPCLGWFGFGMCSRTRGTPVSSSG